MNRRCPGTGRGVGQAGQYDVDDVLGHVVLASGDEDLGTGDLVAAIGLRLGLVRSMPRSVPQCGSVRHMVPVHWPETSLVR